MKLLRLSHIRLSVFWNVSLALLEDIEISLELLKLGLKVGVQI